MSEKSWPRPSDIEHPREIDPATLPGPEREIYDAWVDASGSIRHGDIEALLRKNAELRRIIADLVAAAGDVRLDPTGAKSVADVPTDVLERAVGHADFSHIPHCDGCPICDGAVGG
ncbi:hypothetical protein CKO28_14215 [Rhodovibrio sodomensis]|uniref:Uncharacterized protein n=2 Tax=Rhodovibrio sodomensis TaxID=1088 RepID=A0ABS1DHH0_9PROT|nr:hypothetical protein [Rhodovibrio sodomensis]